MATDTPTGVDPRAKYEEPGYHDKSFGQAVQQDQDLVEWLIADAEGDLDAAEWRFAEESTGAPTAMRQAADAVGDDADIGAAPIDVVLDESSGRYELRVDGRLVARAHLRYEADHVTVTRTEVGEGLSGRGLGGVLAKGLVDDLRRRDVALVAECPFLVEFLRRHPDEQDVLAEPVD